MKIGILYLVMIALFFHFSVNFLKAADNKLDPVIVDNAKNQVMLFYNALRNGDINGIKQRISEEFYQSKKTLLDHNEEYPNFLREYYNGVEIYIANATMLDDAIIMEVEIRFPNGTKNLSKIHLRRQDNVAMAGSQMKDSEIWKVSEVTK